MCLLRLSQNDMNNRIKAIINERRRYIGKLGEMLIVKHLRNKGYALVESNYRKGYGEIDLIMKKDGKIYFIEVKTVSR